MSALVSDRVLLPIILRPVAMFYIRVFHINYEVDVLPRWKHYMLVKSMPCSSGDYGGYSVAAAYTTCLDVRRASVKAAT